MDNQVNSVFDIVGRIPITPTQQHIDAAFNLGKALRSLLPTPITKISFDLDAGIRQSSLTVELQTALVAGMAGIASLTETKNIYEYAYQEGIKVSFAPNSKDLEQPDTTKLTVASAQHQLVLALTTQRAADKLVLTAINGVPVTLDLGTATRVLLLTNDDQQLRELAANDELALRVECGAQLSDDMALMVVEAVGDAVKLCDELRPLETVAGAAVYAAPQAQA
ncbi:hypothetical protein ACFQ5J_09275 [Lacticaseibacillus baoqingensis]|uniref:Uncharacterized protein n=1 Tax=Lacticaseibacillus baoqingensis TaxID=2486013 RepID=A0ABW4E9E5_9LACO|nr:hypothetical protein [Lacticaseibacillus baoqingensis]